MRRIFLSILLICILTISVAPTIRVNAASDPIGRWNLEGNFTDSYGNPGSSVGNVTFGDGVIGQAARFDGSSYINIPDYSRFNNMSYFTLSAWVYPTSYGDYYGTPIISKVDPNRDFNLEINKDGFINFHIEHDSTYMHCYSSTKVPLNKWTHVAAVYSNGMVSLYQNGSLVGQRDYGSFAPYWTGTVMGIGTMDGILFFKGKIDEVKIYNNALSSSDISNLYNSTLPLGIWLFDGNTTDVGPIGNNGTNVGSFPYNTGIIGQAASISSNSQFMQISNYSAFNNMSSFTLLAWIKPTNYSGGTIISKVSPSRDFVFDLQPSGLLDFHIAHDSTYMHCYSSTTIPLNQWTHVAAVYSNGIVSLYQNGSPVGQRDFGTFTPYWTGTLMQVGALVSSYTLKGSIDEVKIFKGSLAASQLNAEYVNGTTGHTP